MRTFYLKNSETLLEVSLNTVGVGAPETRPEDPGVV